MYYQSLDENAIKEGLEKFGPAPGGRKMMDNEYIAAEEAVNSGIYKVYFCPSKNLECFRVGSGSKCFCGHLFGDHNQNLISKKFSSACKNCPCKKFMFIPQRPEEVGMWWLPRRKDFNLKAWRPPCKCKHNHEEHGPNPPYKCSKCTCFDFHSDFACITCDMLWEDHEMIYETEDERKLLKKPIGKDFFPLAKFEDIQNMVFKNDKSKVDPGEYVRPKPVSKSSMVVSTKTVQIKTTIATKPIPKDINDQEEEKVEKVEIKGNNILKLKPTSETSTIKTIETKSNKSNKSTIDNKSNYLKPTTTISKTISKPTGDKNSTIGKQKP